MSESSIDTLNETTFIEYLKGQNRSPENTKMIKYFENQIKFKTQTIHYKDKIKVSMSLIKFIEKYCVSAVVTIFGSFTRNMIEKIFMSESEFGYGNPINHDIDMTIYENKSDYLLDIEKFNNLILLFDIISNSNSFDFNFYGYKLIDIKNKTLKHTNLSESDGFGKEFMIDVPHYTLLLKKNHIIIKYDLIGYKMSNTQSIEQTWQNEFNVNSLNITSSGIYTSRKDTNFFDIIHSVLEREIICNLPFEKLLTDFTQKTRVNKIKILNQIIWFMMYRTKILALGYNKITSYNKFFDYIIEKDEPCDITLNDPPYIKLKLKCSHYISLMGLIGLTNIKSSIWSESLRCPMCRSDLDIKLVDVQPSKIIVPDEPRKKIITQNDYYINFIINSSENINYISHILNSQSVPTNIDFANNGTNDGVENLEDWIFNDPQLHNDENDNEEHFQPLVGVSRGLETYVQITIERQPDIEIATNSRQSQLDFERDLIENQRRARTIRMTDLDYMEQPD